MQTGELFLEMIVQPLDSIRAVPSADRPSRRIFSKNVKKIASGLAEIVKVRYKIYTSGQRRSNERG